MRVPWTTRKSNQSVLKEISPEYSLERLMLKLKLGHLMRRANSLEKTLMLGKVEGKVMSLFNVLSRLVITFLPRSSQFSHSVVSDSATP